MIRLLAFFARAGLRAVLPTLHVDTALIGDGVIGFAVGALVISYYAIYRKYQMALQEVPAPQ